MKRLSDNRIMALSKVAMQWDDVVAQVEVPIANVQELAATGFVNSALRSRAYSCHPITKSDRFAEQGLLGKLRVETTLCTALNIWRVMRRFHCQIRVD